MRRASILAIGAATALAALAPGARAGAGLKIINVHGDPDVLLTLTPTYLPDGKVEDVVHLVNRSKEDYCFRFEIYDDAWVWAPRKVNIVTAPPGSAYEVTRVKIFAAGGKYRYKMDGKSVSKAGITNRDCRKAFPEGFRRTANRD